MRGPRLGETHPAVAEELNRLAAVHWSLGEARQAFEESLQAEEILRAHFGRSLRGLSEREALEYERVRISGLSTALSVLAATSPARLPNDAVERVWMTLVRSRALVLDQMAGLHRAAGSGDDPVLAGLFKDLVAATNREAALVVRGPEPAHPERYVSELDGATRDKEALERRLAGASASFKTRLQQDPSTIDELRQSIPSTAGLVAYALYERSRPRASSPEGTGGPPRAAAPAYIAFVLGGTLRPAAVPIGSTQEIDRLIEKWRARSAAPPAPLEAGPQGPDRELRDLGGALRAKIWEPLSRVLGSPELVLVVPDGAINLVNFMTLPVGEGKYLVESGPIFHYLSAERDLLALAEPVPGSGRGLLMLGGPDFDARPETSSAPAAQNTLRPASSVSGPEAQARGHYRSPAPSCVGLGAVHFDPLPASTREVDEIRAVVARGGATSGLAASDVLELTEARASEEAFKSLAPGRRILHLATHAFFLERGCASSLTSATTGDRPLLLSGLAVAGANRRGDAVAGAEDGVLTAEEIATLDLSGVEWAVLSACESGLGPIQTGEGVLGLRRAFTVAGVRTLITSLWKVDDESTTEWMRDLYEGRLNGMTTAESVRHASLVMLEARRSAGRSTNPFFWGAFAAAGDWR